MTTPQASVELVMLRVCIKHKHSLAVVHVCKGGGVLPLFPAPLMHAPSLSPADKEQHSMMNLPEDYRMYGVWGSREAWLEPSGGSVAG
jgi:hypothetical protein